MKSKILIAVISTLSLVLAAPHRHRNPTTSLEYKGDFSSMTNADNRGGGCPCGTAPDEFDNCIPFTCPTEPTCATECSNTLATTDQDMLDKTGDIHHTLRYHKACRFNNDASCHRCATTSCQYRFGNFFATGVPCISREVKGPETGFYSPIDYNTGEGLTVTVTNQYGTNPSSVTFCNTDLFELSLMTCDPFKNKYAAVVIPKTCTHCQTLRCVDPQTIVKYDQWNSFDYLGMTAFNDGVNYLYNCYIFDEDTSQFVQVIGYNTGTELEDGTFTQGSLVTINDTPTVDTVIIGRQTSECRNAGSFTWKTMYFSYIGPSNFRNDHEVTKLSDVVEGTWQT